LVIGTGHSNKGGWGRKKEPAEAEVEKLESHAWLLGVLENALKDKVWKDASDGRVDWDILDNRPLMEAEKEKVGVPQRRGV
jgi:hypothetical protein